jgi:hypothetical protein
VSGILVGHVIETHPFQGNVVGHVIETTISGHCGWSCDRTQPFQGIVVGHVIEHNHFRMAVGHMIETRVQ